MLHRLDFISGSDRPAGLISRQSHFQTYLPFETRAFLEHPCGPKLQREVPGLWGQRLAREMLMVGSIAWAAKKGPAKNIVF